MICVLFKIIRYIVLVYRVVFKDVTPAVCYADVEVALTVVVVQEVATPEGRAYDDLALGVGLNHSVVTAAAVQGGEGVWHLERGKLEMAVCQGGPTPRTDLGQPVDAERLGVAAVLEAQDLHHGFEICNGAR